MTEINTPRDWVPEDGPPPAGLIIGTGEVPYVPAGRPGQPLPPQFGPKPGALNLARAREQVQDLAVRMANRMAALNVRLEGGSGSTVAQAASVLHQVLSASEPQARRHAANTITAALLDLGQLTDPDWWRTDLGRVLAREIGWWSPWPSRQVAAAVLDVTKQAVAQMIALGDLEERRDDGSPGGVTALSLQEAAAKRWPRDTDIQ